MSSRLNRIILFVRGVSTPGSSVLLPSATLSFYAKSLRLPLSKAHPSWAEFATVPPLMIAASVDPQNFPSAAVGAGDASGAAPSSLPSSIYSVSVPQGSSLTDMLSDCLTSGAVLDGPIQHKAFGTVAVVICPEGLHRFSLVEEAGY